MPCLVAAICLPLLKDLGSEGNPAMGNGLAFSPQHAGERRRGVVTI